MTRSEDIFWGIYAAIIPYVILNGIAYLIWLLEKYRARTYNVMPAFAGVMLLMLFMGILLAILAIYFLSKPMETSKVPMIGLLIGLAYSVIVGMYWPLLFIGIDLNILWSFLPKAGGETRVFLVLGFYIVLTIVYMKTRTYIPKEELKKGLKTDNDQEFD